ncbi:MAG: PUA domain-containing protein, partial [Candidatus Hydrothermarchaeales archaeon]
WELVERHCKAHPQLLDALHTLKEYPLERYEPLTKPSAFFYSGPESLQRPEVKRHRERLSRLTTPAKSLVLLRDIRRWDSRSSMRSNKDYHVCYISPVFGVIPTEIEEVYPLGQNVYPHTLDEAQVSMMKKVVQDYARGFEKVLFDKELSFLDMEGEPFDELNLKRDTTIKMTAMGDYQFGEGAGEVLFKGCVGRYARTGRLRHVFEGDTLVATVRASDGIIVPALEGAKRLLKLKAPRNRVVVEDDEVCNFIKEGKSVFAKFITSCDSDIVPGSEVIVVDKNDELVNWGRAVLDARELLAFKVGVGVKVRGSIKNDRS